MFLAIVVVCNHMSIFASMPRPYEFLHSLSGVDAVLLFLFISGYSIAHSVTKEASGFYRRRFWRLMPVYWVCMVVSLVPYWMHGAGIHAPHFGIKLLGSAWAFPYHLLPLDALRVPPLWSNPATWSLGVEVVLYAMAPWLRRWRTPWIVAVMVASAVWYAKTPLVDAHHLVFPFDTVIKFGWAWLAGFLYYRHSRALWAQLLPFLAWFEVTRYSLFHQPHGITMCLVFGALIVALRYLPAVPSKAVPPLHWLGDVSYPLYLIHMPVMWIIWVGSRSMSSNLYFVAVIAVAVVIYHAVDLPARAAVRKHGKRQSTA